MMLFATLMIAFKNQFDAVRLNWMDKIKSIKCKKKLFGGHLVAENVPDCL